jgi:hypothetical protein
MPRRITIEADRIRIGPRTINRSGIERVSTRPQRPGTTSPILLEVQLRGSAVPEVLAYPGHGSLNDLRTLLETRYGSSTPSGGSAA